MDNKPSKDEDIEFLRDIKEDVAKKLPEYEVGYCKPPTHTRFKKGVSGNPAGRKISNSLLYVILFSAFTNILPKFNFAY